MENIIAELGKETPWAWYISRAAGLIGFIFLWLAVFLGLAIRNPKLKKIIEPVYTFDFHCFLAGMAAFWALVHGTSFLFHGTFSLGIKDVFIPFYSKTALANPNLLALGIMAFYAIVVLTITSYLRRHLSYQLWRVIHFLNPLAFAFVVIHGFFIGTDMKNIFISTAYLTSSVFIVMLYIYNLIFAVRSRYQTQENTRQIDNLSIKN